MNSSLIVQSRELSATDLHWLQELIAAHPEWSRYRLSREICQAWNWVNGKGQLKDIACRTMLRKLDGRGYLRLPPPQRLSPNRYRHAPARPVAHDDTPIEASLSAMSPVRCELVETATLPLFEWLLASYHYLSYRQPVGENLKYLVSDREGRPLAGLLFGAAAWKCEARDRWIGWSPPAQRRHLHLVANHHRFLIFPWVTVQHLASHVLGMVCRRLSRDWQERYGHPLMLVETFVEEGRFAGTCYRAANWQKVGMTKGRSRNDRYSTLVVPVKAVYCLALHAVAVEALTDES